MVVMIMMRRTDNDNDNDNNDDDNDNDTDNHLLSQGSDSKSYWSITNILDEDIEGPRQQKDYSYHRIYYKIDTNQINVSQRIHIG